jgi:hypothetical protein
MISAGNLSRADKCERQVWLHNSGVNDGSQTPDAMTTPRGIHALFPSASFVAVIEGKEEEAAAATKLLMGTGATLLHQATAIHNGAVSVIDVLRREENGWKPIFSTDVSKLTDRHYRRVALAEHVFQNAGIPLLDPEFYILNEQYRPREESPANKLYRAEPLSADALIEARAHIFGEIERLRAILTLAVEPETLPVKQCNRGKDNPCPFIEAHCYKGLPDFSVYDLQRLGEARLRDFLQRGIVDVRDIPADTKLNRIQKLHVEAARSGKPHIDIAAIRKRLAGLRYPLYFLDYETYASPYPLFPEYKPHQQMVFQYSLHVQHEPGGKLEHSSYLAEDGSKNPVPDLTEQLMREIGPDGSVIVWYDAFEGSRNREMGEMPPYQREFYRRLNARMFDLMLIFKDGLYVDAGFRGSYSLKRVLPVLAPQLRYNDLSIKNGRAASEGWYHMTFEGITEIEREQIHGNLLQYCHLDTLAMVKILQFLEQVIAIKAI